jgi:hypothetical protein
MKSMTTPTKRPRALFALVTTISALLLSPLQTHADEPEKLNLPKAIHGTMDIDFASRKNTDDKGKPKAGMKDTYTMALTVAGTTEFSGKIVRLPNLKKWGGYKTVQEAGLGFEVNVAVLNPANPAQKKTVGVLVGNVSMNPDGKYDPSGVRMAINQVGKARAFESKSRGAYYGKAGKEATAGQKALSFARNIGGKVVKIESKGNDPLRFEGLVLPAGPAEAYAETTVNGDLVYDYDTGNYYTNGIKMNYMWDGKAVADTVTGSIKFVEDPQRESNGKSKYEFNLRWNEDANRPKSTESDAFKKLSDEDAFFAVDNTVPSLSGTIEYTDTFVGGSANKTPGSSKLVLTLDAYQLTKQQILSLHKLLLFIVGPFNDE